MRTGHADLPLHSGRAPRWLFERMTALARETSGAVKEGLRGIEREAGLTVTGGKGRASRRTPAEIEAACWRTGLDAGPRVQASRLTAKVDSSALQDGFQVYHHCFLLADDGSWAVVQQGMNEASGTARRYHWLTARRFDAIRTPP